MCAQPATATPPWPSAVDVASRALNDENLPPELGIAIVEDSDALHIATARVILVSATTHPSRAVRRAAFQRCARRRVEACLPSAIDQWRRGLDPDPESLAAYLSVLRLFVDGQVGAMLVDALHSPDPSLRAATALSLLDATISDAVRPDILRALTARAADQVPSVRAAVLPTLSALDPGGRSAALLQGLDDPEPVVRASAATALGRRADRRFGSRLIRMLESPSTPEVAAAVLGALAQTPGPEVDEALIRYLESPPTHLAQTSIGRTLANRSPFSAATRDRLLMLLGTPPLEDTVFRILVGNLSPEDLSEIRARLRSHTRVSPSMRATLETLVVGSEAWTPSAATVRSTVTTQDMPRAHVAMVGRRAQRVVHAFEHPPSSSERASLRLFRSLASAPELPTTEALLWLFLASSTLTTADPWRPPNSRTRALGRAELKRWATDVGRATSTRCAALWATLRSASDPGERRAAWELTSRQLSARPEMRHCAALALALVPPTFDRRAGAHNPRPINRARRHIFTRSLLDKDPRVRAAALLAGWINGVADIDMALRRSTRDPHPRVRQLASALTIATPPASRYPENLFLVRPSAATQRPVHGWLWTRLEDTSPVSEPSGMSIPVPTLPHLPFAILPLRARPDVPPLERTD